MLKCPYCGSNNIETTGGENGNPFDCRPEKTVCLDCGRTLREDAPPKKAPLPDLSTAGRMMDELERAQQKKPVVVIEMTAKAAGITRAEKAEIPYEDGTYSLHDCPYPLSRFGGVIIRGDTIELDEDISKLTGNALETTKHYTAYAPDKHLEQETIEIKIYVDRGNL